MIKIKFKDFIKLNRGFDLPNTKIIEGKYPVVASTSIKGYHNEFKVLSPLVVTGRSGSLGSLQYVEKNGTPLNTTLYVKDFKGNLPKYVFYYLQTIGLENFNSGAGVPTLNQNHLHNMTLYIHDLQIQTKIANILSVYDDLIENNNCRIKLLEKSAQELYKEWFARFRFPNYKNTKFEKGIPVDWDVKKLGEVVEIVDGDRGKNYPKKNEFTNFGYCLFLNTGNVKENGFDYSDVNFILEEKDIILRKGKLICNDIVVTTRGTLGNMAFYSEKTKYKNVRINSGMVIIRKKDDVHTPQFIYSTLLSDIFKFNVLMYSSGAAQPQLPIKDMKKIKIMIPNEDLIRKFTNCIKPIFEQIEILKSQNQNLKKQRDLLLPRLMSGKIEV